ncbi:flagellar biosynthetic protein FliR [Shimia sediminis]|uniref:flagellar biosynthetic protein FliR n=1 Tax=Shimia sediminis TaxID=2497945 RepID=UPI000F8EF9BD|nr:flagellar biosynthetic protein FliR [Shimia sediminis]
MIQAVETLLDSSVSLWWQWFAVFLRVSGLVSFLPAFGEQTVPMRVRLAVAVALSLVVFPAAGQPNIDFSNLSSVAVGATAELLNGVLLGLGLRILVMALQTAGAIAAQATSLSQLLGGASADPMPALGQVLVLAGLALAVTTGLHVRATVFLVSSYDILPAGQFPSASIIGQWGTVQVSQAFALAFQLAAPFVIASVLYNLTLGVINRAMPQLMVAFVGAPVITAAGLVLLLLSFPIILSLWLEALHMHLDYPFSEGR